MNPLFTRPLALTASLVLAGCQAALFEALSRAQEAEARNDVVAAALGYREACRLGPSDSAVCGKASDLARAAIEHALREARVACTARDVAGCLGAIRPVTVLGDDPRLGEMADEAGRLHADLCEGRPLSSPPDALAVVLCLESLAKDVPTAAYRARVRRARGHAARWAAAVARAAPANQPGSAYAMFSLAACLDGRDELKEQRDEARAKFYERAAVPTWVFIRGEPSTIPALADYCLRLQQSGRLPEAARCDRTAPAPRLDLRVDAERQAADRRLAAPGSDALAGDAGTAPQAKPRWESDWTARFTFQGEGGREPFTDSGAIVFKDEEKAPGPTFFDDELAARLGSRIAAALAGELKARGAERLAECGRAAPARVHEWLECWAEGTLWRDGDPGPRFLAYSEAGATGSDEGDSTLPVSACAP